MVRVIAGDRIAKEGRLGVGCSAFIFDKETQRVLLACRADDSHWCVPGGYMEPGESFSEACAREVREETGLTVELKRLLSIYTSPHKLLVYADGNKWQVVCLHFEVEIVGGSLTASSETSALAYYSLLETRGLKMHGMDRSRVWDGFSQQPNTIIYDDVELD